jgi:hypothetical protein
MPKHYVRNGSASCRSDDESGEDTGNLGPVLRLPERAARFSARSLRGGRHRGTPSGPHCGTEVFGLAYRAATAGKLSSSQHSIESSMDDAIPGSAR